MNDSNTVSVIVPVYNGADYLAAALESVLGQEHGGLALDVIVVNDGSTDGSHQVAQGFESAIRYIEQPNRGIAAARNAGLAMAVGGWIGFCDADDLWVQGRLVRQLDFLKQRPDVGAVYGLVQNLEGQVPDNDAPPIVTLQQGAKGRLMGAGMFRRDAFFAVGRFSANARVGETLDWVLRADESGLKHHTIDELVLWRRIHGENSGIADRLAQHGGYVRALKASLDRRRGAASLSGASSDDP